MTRNRLDIPTNAPTRWEVAVIRGEIILEVLGYTARRTKMGIYNLVAHDLTRHFTESELNADLVYSAKTGFTFGTDLRVGFSGRTERDVAV